MICIFAFRNVRQRTADDFVSVFALFNERNVAPVMSSFRYQIARKVTAFLFEPHHLRCLCLVYSSSSSFADCATSRGEQAHNFFNASQEIGWEERTSPKRPIVCRLGRKTSTHHLNRITNDVITVNSGSGDAVNPRQTYIKWAIHGRRLAEHVKGDAPVD